MILLIDSIKIYPIRMAINLLLLVQQIRWLIALEFVMRRNEKWLVAIQNIGIAVLFTKDSICWYCMQ